MNGMLLLSLKINIHKQTYPIIYTKERKILANTV